MRPGAGLCHEDVVRTIVEEGPARIAELMELGMKFSEREVNGARELDLGREGGHSKRRILHAKDVTGREIERALLAAVAAQPNIEIFENHIAIDLITTQKIQGSASCSPAPNRCLGAYVLDKNRNAVETFSARAVLLATGGCGKVYLYTTNPDIATGDGVAMAYRAGAARRQHGIHPVPSDLPLSSEGQIVSDQRSGARRGGRLEEPSRARRSWTSIIRSSRWRRATSWRGRSTTR